MREPHPERVLTERQQEVLRAIVRAYVADASPVSSATVSYLLSVSRSPATIRNTMAELTELGLIQKPHASSGRIPTESGMRVFVDDLVAKEELAAYERRTLDYSFEMTGTESAVQVASQMLSQHSHQLGFVLPPRMERLVLRRVSLVRLSSERILVVLVTRNAEAHRLVIDDAGSGDQRELEQVSAALNARVDGRTLSQVRESLGGELRELRDEADRLLVRAISLGLKMVEGSINESAEIVVASRLALLQQPEMSDPEYLREVFSAIEAQERLIELLDTLLDTPGVSVALGDELAEPGLNHSALVVAPYESAASHRGILGVLGPQRMDYGHTIALVDYCSRLLTGKLAT